MPVRSNHLPHATPRHVAIIQDGNGRWAERQGKPRAYGHECGVNATRKIVQEAYRQGVEVLTLYSFSVENWNRPTEEVEYLMRLFCVMLERELPELHKNQTRIIHVGSRDGLPDNVLRMLDRAVAMTANNDKLTLALAWNYGGRSEIIDAVRSIGRDVAAGRITPDQIDETRFSDRLYTAGLPDPDLLIRTAGEMRISNFLLWQISYAELWITQTLWPDFDEAEFQQALRDYAARQRKFGGVVKGTT